MEYQAAEEPESLVQELLENDESKGERNVSVTSGGKKHNSKQIMDIGNCYSNKVNILIYKVIICWCYFPR